MILNLAALFTDLIHKDGNHQQLLNLLHRLKDKDTLDDLRILALEKMVRRILGIVSRESLQVSPSKSRLF